MAIAKLAPDGCSEDFTDYTVHFNAHDILSLTFRSSGVGAYPFTSTYRLTIDSRTGAIFDGNEAFVADKLAALAAQVDRKLQRAVAARPTDGEGNRWQPERWDGPPRFGVAQLHDVLVTSRSLVFLYDYGIPHGARILTPKSEFVMTAAELAPFVSPRGPLAWLARH